MLTVGSIIGGLCEHPVENYPFLFGRSELLARYPYLLPCLVSSSITLTGAFLCLFLGRDGGPRSGAIKLPIEKTTEEGQANADVESTPRARPRSLSKRLSGYFNLPLSPAPKLSRDPSYHALHRPESPSYGTHLTADASTSAVSPESTPRRTRPSFGGTSYGYSTRRPSVARPWSRRFTMESGRRGSMGTQYAPDFEGIQPPDLSSLNFAQRLLLANEEAVLNISDLWVQACAAQTFEDDDTYSQMDPDASVFDQDDDPEADQSGDFSILSEDSEQSPFLAPPRASSPAPRRMSNSRQAGKPGLGSLSLNGLPNLSQRPRMVSRQSTASSTFARPRIFSNTGLSSQPALFSPSADAGSAPAPAAEANPLATIHEQHVPGRSSPAQEAAPVPPATTPAPAESPFKDLPRGIILQYFIVAFHSTATDQVCDALDSNIDLTSADTPILGVQHIPRHTCCQWRSGLDGLSLR